MRDTFPEASVIIPDDLVQALTCKPARYGYACVYLTSVEVYAMAKKGTTEFVLGEFLTFSGVVDAAIHIVDYYSRWEVLVSLQQQVPLLAHPATPLILLLGGLFLIQRSVQKSVADSIRIAHDSRLRDHQGNLITLTVSPPSMKLTYVSWVRDSLRQQ